MIPTVKRHPEQRPDELWLGNVRTGRPQPLLSKIPSHRIGLQAFDIDGGKLHPMYYRPSFIKQSDLALHEKLRKEEFEAIARKYKL
jgi:hypothetical protein